MSDESPAAEPRYATGGFIPRRDDGEREAVVPDSGCFPQSLLKHYGRGLLESLNAGRPGTTP